MQAPSLIDAIALILFAHGHFSMSSSDARPNIPFLTFFDNPAGWGSRTAHGVQRVTPRLRPAAFCTPDPTGRSAIGGHSTSAASTGAVKPACCPSSHASASSGPCPPWGPQDDLFVSAHTTLEHDLDAILASASSAAGARLAATACSRGRPGEADHVSDLVSQNELYMPVSPRRAAHYKRREILQRFCTGRFSETEDISSIPHSKRAWHHQAQPSITAIPSVRLPVEGTPGSPKGLASSAWEPGGWEGVGHSAGASSDGSRD